MAYITLDFLNKNMYRKYPIKATSSHIFNNGQLLPMSLIVAMQITTIFAYSKVYISKVYVKNNYLSILLREIDTNLVLGTFGGFITTYKQVLNLIPTVPQISGTLTIGDPNALTLIQGANWLTTTNGALEDSTIFCFTPPGVTLITSKNQSANGFITLTGTNITLAESSPTIELKVINTTSILSNNDMSGEANNCGVPLIYAINTVTPDSNGNIDVYGVTPVTIAILTNQIGIGATSLTLPDVCPEKNLLSPPYNTSETYYADISTTEIPEWKTWPQYSS